MKIIRSAGGDIPMASVTAVASNKPQAIGTIAIPARDHMNTLTAMSLTQTDWSWAKGAPVEMAFYQGNVLTLQRNEAVHQMKGDWLIFIDDDMVWRPDDIGFLVDAYNELKDQFPDTPIMVGGLCVRRVPPFQPTLYMREQPNEGKFNFMENWDTDMVEVDATGMAFILIEKAVFEAVMGGPMPEDRSGLPPWQHFEWVGSVGEDLSFCIKARAAGARIFVDTRIRTGHVGEVTFTLEHFWQQIAQRSPELEAQRRAVNDGMGLLTLSSDEAKKRLGQ